MLLGDSIGGQFEHRAVDDVPAGEREVGVCGRGSGEVAGELSGDDAGAAGGVEDGLGRRAVRHRRARAAIRVVVSAAAMARWGEGGGEGGGDECGGGGRVEGWHGRGERVCDGCFECLKEMADSKTRCFLTA